MRPCSSDEIVIERGGIIEAVVHDTETDDDAHVKSKSCYGVPTRAFLGVLLIAWLLAGVDKVAEARESVLPPQEASRVDSQATRISFKESLLSIDAIQRPWFEVLDELRGATGMQFHISAPLTGTVTVSCTELPVKQALERLFGPEADFVFRYPEGAPQPLAVPQEVWVLGKVEAANARALPITASKAVLGSETSPPSIGLDPAMEGSNQSVTDAVAPDAPEDVVEHDEETLEELVERARSDKDAETRVQALTSLSGHAEADEGAVESALDAALTDKDPGVRGYAVQAIASRKGPAATEQLRQALKDSDPDVRTMAVDSVVPKEQGLALLQEALSDADELVRTIARDRLKQAESQGAD